MRDFIYGIIIGAEGTFAIMSILNAIREEKKIKSIDKQRKDLEERIITDDRNRV